ncbi:MAG TPA: hypothetical protein VJ890_07945, partial [Vineibacter sp.]|nr:hypothetical protein [Vineibacter sp.]
ELRVQFEKPSGGPHSATITFRFKTKDVPKGFSFGIKQFISLDWWHSTYKGNKAEDGWIWEAYRAPKRHMLDVSPRSLTVIFHPETNLPTGATATAPQAPFFDFGPAIVKNGVEFEQSIEDSPGGSFALELRNAATDRVNFMDDLSIKQTFLTVLTAVKPDGSHVPLEAAYWQNTIQGAVTWTGPSGPDISKLVYSTQGVGTFKDIQSNFLVFEFSLLADTSLSVRDCVVQQMNDAMFAVRGMYQGQNFSSPTRTETKVAAKGYEIVQYPMRP